MRTDFITYSKNTQVISEERAIKKLKNRILTYYELYNEFELNNMTYRDLLQLELMLFIKIQKIIKELILFDMKKSKNDCRIKTVYGCQATLFVFTTWGGMLYLLVILGDKI